MISARHGWMAFICAALMHVLALGLFFAAPSEGAKDKGEQGIEVDLGMLGNLGESLNTTEDVPADPIKELTAEAPPQQEPPKEVSKEPAKEPAKEALQKPEPEPLKQAEVPQPPKQNVALKVKQTARTAKTETKQVQATKQKVSVAEKKISTGVGDAQTTGGNPGAEQTYFALLAATLAKNKRYPTASRRKGEEGVVVLSFVVDRFGLVSAAQIKTSSGFSRLDDAVMRMLKKSKRLPAFPKEMMQAQLLINIPISFELNAMR